MLCMIKMKSSQEAIKRANTRTALTIYAVMTTYISYCYMEYRPCFTLQKIKREKLFKLILLKKK